jgi:hypothetical protein
LYWLIFPSAPAIQSKGKAEVPPVQNLSKRRSRNGIRRLLHQVSQEADNQGRHRREDVKRPANSQGDLSSVWDESHAIPVKQGCGIVAQSAESIEETHIADLLPDILPPGNFKGCHSEREARRISFSRRQIAIRLRDFLRLRSGQASLPSVAQNDMSGSEIADENPVVVTARRPHSRLQALPASLPSPATTKATPPGFGPRLCVPFPQQE